MILSSNLKADILEHYKLTPVDKNSRIFSTSIINYYSGSNADLDSNSLFTLEKNRELNIGYIDLKKNSFGIDLFIKDLEFNRSFLPKEKKFTNYKIKLITINNPRINVLNDWYRTFSVFYVNQPNSITYCYENERTVIGKSKNCEKPGKNFNLTEKGEIPIVSKLNSLGSGISLIKEIHGWKRKTTLEVGMEYFYNQSDIKLSNTLKAIYDNYTINFPQNGYWIESKINSSYTDTKIINKDFAVGININSFVYLTTGYLNKYKKNNNLNYEINLMLSKNFGGNNIFNIGSTYSNFLDNYNASYYSTKNYLSNKSNYSFYIRLTKIFSEPSMSSATSPQNQTYSGTLLKRQKTEILENIDYKAVYLKPEKTPNTKQPKVIIKSQKKPKLEISLKDYALNYAKIYDKNINF